MAKCDSYHLKELIELEKGGQFIEALNCFKNKIQAGASRLSFGPARRDEMKIWRAALQLDPLMAGQVELNHDVF